MATPSRIADFYAGKSVFITGATGLIGKVLLERLLQTCPEICKIYVLVRNKHGVNERRRVEKLVKCQAFDHIRKTSPETLNKIEAIPGDLTAPELGISPNDQETLMKNVSIVFHSAATVRFDEPLKSSVQMNVVGTLSVINLCKRLRDLKAIVHISTAYCNCEHSFIEERIYPTSHDYEDIVQSSRWMTADEMDAIFPQLKGAKPNTYAYTKSLAEQMIGRVGAGLPIAILRPTVVGNSCKEPFPGWVDSANGGGGLLTALANGAWRFSRTSKTSLADLVPVDYCANAMIVLGWRSGTTCEDFPRVYNFSLKPEKRMTWKATIEATCEASRTEYCYETTLWYPSHTHCSNRWLFKLGTTLCEALPAYIADKVLNILGKKPFAMKVYQRMQQNALAVEYFLNRTWEFETKNINDLWNSLNDEDQKIFPFDTGDVDMKNLLYAAILGIRSYFLKQDPKTLDQSYKRMRRLFWIHQVTKFAGILLTFRFVFFVLGLRSSSLFWQKK